MSTKNARAGGKYTSSHTTVVPAAGVIVDIAHKCTSVTKISLGFIKAGLPSAKGLKRVKIVDEGTSIVLSVRDNTSQQEIRIYTSDKIATKQEISKGARKAGFMVRG